MSDNIAVGVQKLEKKFGDFTAVNKINFEGMHFRRDIGSKALI